MLKIFNSKNNRYKKPVEELTTGQLLMVEEDFDYINNNNPLSLYDNHYYFDKFLLVILISLISNLLIIPDLLQYLFVIITMSWWYKKLFCFKQNIKSYILTLIGYLSIYFVLNLFFSFINNNFLLIYIGG